MSQPIYLDNAAATPVDDRVLTAMLPYFSQTFHNPSANYAAAKQAHAELEAARAQVAHWLGARNNEIIFTAGGSEANNLAIHGIMRKYPEANVVTSSIEHDSVLVPAGQYNHRLVAVTVDGIIDLADVRAKIDDQTVLVSVMQANNEVGTVQPIRELTQLVAEVRKQRTTGLPLYVHVDSAQATNYLDLHVARLGVDMMTLNGGKIYGPKQSGALFVKAGLQLQPLIDGGGQERGLRSGTENVAAAVGFATALDMAQTMRHEEVERLSELRDAFIKQLVAAVPAIVINGSRKHRLPNNVHLTIPGADNERLLFALDEAGIQAAAGSACSASDEEPSHVLKAMGISDADAEASLRFTLGRDTTAAMLDETVQQLRRIAPTS